MVTESEIKNALKTVIDPELGYNIVDLGLIYKIQINPESQPSNRPNIQPSSIVVTMTLTSPGCPLAPFFTEAVKEAVAAAATVKPEDITIDLTFDPPWTPETIHPDLRLELGL